MHTFSVRCLYTMIIFRVYSDDTWVVVMPTPLSHVDFSCVVFPHLPRVRTGAGGRVWSADDASRAGMVRVAWWTGVCGKRRRTVPSLLFPRSLAPDMSDRTSPIRSRTPATARNTARSNAGEPSVSKRVQTVNEALEEVTKTIKYNKKLARTVQKEQRTFCAPPPPPSPLPPCLRTNTPI